MSHGVRYAHWHGCHNVLIACRNKGSNRTAASEMTRTIVTNKKGSKFEPTNNALLEENVQFLMEPIAFVENSMKNKSGVPRQGSEAQAIQSVIRMRSAIPHMAPNCAEHSIADLRSFSHLWVISFMNRSQLERVRVERVSKNDPACVESVIEFKHVDNMGSKCEPPRLLRNHRVSRFATRTPRRPNPIGLTLCMIEKIEGLKIFVRGLDLVDGTPIVDLKPYIPMYDSIPVPDGINSKNIISSDSARSHASASKVVVPDWILSAPLKSRKVWVPSLALPRLLIEDDLERNRILQIASQMLSTDPRRTGVVVQSQNRSNTEMPSLIQKLLATMEGCETESVHNTFLQENSVSKPFVESLDGQQEMNDRAKKTSRKVNPAETLANSFTLLNIDKSAELKESYSLFNMTAPSIDSCVSKICGVHCPYVLNVEKYVFHVFFPPAKDVALIALISDTGIRDITSVV